MVLFHTVTIGLWFFQYVHYSGGTNKMETFTKLNEDYINKQKKCQTINKNTDMISMS